jgi:hypothetical protein
MTISSPAYLRAANLRDPELRYEWDDWRTLPALQKRDEQLLVRLSAITQRAVLALACASAEWIVQRLAWLCADTSAWSYIEAAWATTVDIRYVGYGNNGWQVYAYKGWDGPVRRPIRNTLNYLEIAFRQLAEGYQDDPLSMTSRIAVLVRYVMPDPVPYNDWSERVLQRLAALYPRNPSDRLGDVVPRQALDPGIAFQIEDTEALVQTFLRSLDYGSNPFLSTPEAMLTHFDGDPDFKGKPYAFDIEADRRSRQEWHRAGGYPV